MSNARRGGADPKLYSGNIHTHTHTHTEQGRRWVGQCTPPRAPPPTPKMLCSSWLFNVGLCTELVGVHGWCKSVERKHGTKRMFK